MPSGKLLILKGSSSGQLRAFFFGMYLRDTIPQQDRIPVLRYVVFTLWLFMAVLYVSLASQWIVPQMQDQAFTEYVDHIVALGAAEHRSATEIRTLIAYKAADLSLPIRYEGIRVNGGGDSLEAVVSYESDIRIPLLNHPIYWMKFEHSVTPRARR